MSLAGRPLFALAGTVMIILLAIASSVVLAGGFKGRFPVGAVQIASEVSGTDEPSSMRTGTCFITTGDRFEQYKYDVC